MRALETRQRPVSEIPPATATGIECETCERPTWRWISFDGKTARAMLCCLGPGDPWLGNQNTEEYATWPERAARAAQAADRMEAATGVRP